ncbi:UNVERIFIED_CONTAM: Nascent polypeptide-associated complex subunit beta [Sesamum angustifolium]|uniref:Nascent polypeptide-associated complex subunit beta n=1 Tax=Sesamum angustifolium TaxID=2727405 RepID=A0AAW2RMF8_9LAMI
MGNKEKSAGRKDPDIQMNVEKLMKMAGSVRTGGKGTMRRIGVNAIPAIEEVNIFKEDVVIQFINPKELQDILPQIIHQLGPDNLENLKKLAEQFQKQAPAAAGAAAGSTVAPENADDDEVPDLVPGETFEAAAEEGNTHTS